MTEKNEIMDEQVNSAITEDDAFTFVQNEEDTPCENAEIDEVNLVESQGNIIAENNEQVAEESTEINDEQDDELSKGKLSQKKKGIPTRKLCGMAVLTALAVVLACTIHVPYFGAGFLEYSPSDVPVLIASFM